MPWDWKRDPVSGDLVKDGKGGFVRVFTAETSAQNQLLAHERKCWHDPALGSSLHDQRSKQRDPITLNVEAARRALTRLEAAGRIAAIEVKAEPASSPAGRVLLATTFRDTSTGQLIETVLERGGG